MGVHFESYPVFVWGTKENSVCLTFPDFQGLGVSGVVPSKREQVARDILQGHVDGLLAVGSKVPCPTQPVTQAGVQSPDDWFTVSVYFLEKFKKANITVPGMWLERIDKAAEVLGLTRSAFLLMAAKREIQELEDE
jgi:hypothetical protein